MAVDWKTLLGWKDRETLSLEAFQDLADRASLLTNLNLTGSFRTTVDLCMEGVAKLWNLAVAVVPQGFPQHATGEWLDAHALALGTARQAAVAAQWSVTFTKVAAPGNVVVPAGTIAATEPDTAGRVFRFRLPTDQVIPDGELTGALTLLAVTPGAQHNVAVNTIKVLEQAVTGIASVLNDDADGLVAEGTDAEADKALQARLPLRWEELARGSTRAAYEGWAREVAGVTSVNVLDDFPRGPGTVDIVIQGPEGAPSSALVDEVQAYVDVRRPITANVLVRGPTEDAIDADITIELHPDTDDEQAALDEATARWQALFTPDDAVDTEILGTGRDYRVARVIAELMKVPNVVNVRLWDPDLGEPTPAEDIEIPADGLAVAGDLVIFATVLEEL